MISLFRKQETKNVNDIIDEIHETFYTEVDRLLADAKISKSMETDKTDLLKKAERLDRLGFNNTKESWDAKVEGARLREIENENNEKKDLVDAISYFSFKYPHYKFITESSVKKICEKYNLIYGEVGNYKGDVPDRNLEHIENFKIDELDMCCIEKMNYHTFNRSNYISFSTYKDRKNQMEYKDHLLSMHYKYEKCPLEIAAPIKDFDTRNMEVKDFKLSKIEIPDPVVLQPVMFGGKKHYLIVTAWGQEASDELVLNPIHN